jgi:polyribonucleotide nucleotidyltransferase
MDIKITGVTFEIMRDALTRPGGPAVHPRRDERRHLRAPQGESKWAPRIIQLKIEPDKIGLLIGKGGETIRGLQDEFESQIDVNDEGQVLVYSANGELGRGPGRPISSMTKEVEIGDSFTGKVVKTTTFGAFVELAKGTDGLLHISNVAPGQRAENVEDHLSKGDEIKVRVVEVDRERGRIGLRLADDPAIEGKSVEELATVGAGRRRGGNGGARRERGGGDRGDAARA